MSSSSFSLNDPSWYLLNLVSAQSSKIRSHIVMLLEYRFNFHRSLLSMHPTQVTPVDLLLVFFALHEVLVVLAYDALWTIVWVILIRVVVIGIVLIVAVLVVLLPSPLHLVVQLVVQFPLEMFSFHGYLGAVYIWDLLLDQGVILLPAVSDVKGSTSKDKYSYSTLLSPSSTTPRTDPPLIRLSIFTTRIVRLARTYSLA